MRILEHPVLSRTVIPFSLALLVFGGCGSKSDDAGALKLLPPDLPALLVVDVARVRSSSTLKLDDAETAILGMLVALKIGPGPADAPAVAAVPPGSGMPEHARAWLSTFTGTTGIEPLRDIDMVISGFEKTGEGRGSSLHIYSGRNLTEEKVTAWMRLSPFGTKFGERVDVEGAGTYLMPKGAGIDMAMTAYSFPDATTMVTGRGPLVHRVLSLAKGTAAPGGSAGAVALAKECAETSVACYATTDATAVRSSLRTLASTGLENAQAIVAWLVLDPAVGATVRIRLASAVEAPAAVEAVTAGLALAKAGFGARIPFLAKVLDQITVAAVESDVVLSLTPTPELFAEVRTTLMKMASSPGPGVGRPGGAPHGTMPPGRMPPPGVRPPGAMPPPRAMPPPGPVAPPAGTASAAPATP